MTRTLTCFYGKITMIFATTDRILCSTPQWWYKTFYTYITWSIDRWLTVEKFFRFASAVHLSEVLGRINSIVQYLVYCCWGSWEMLIVIWHNRVDKRLLLCAICLPVFRERLLTYVATWMQRCVLYANLTRWLCTIFTNIYRIIFSQSL